MSATDPSAAVRGRLAELSAGAWGLAALGAAAELGVVEALGEPAGLEALQVRTGVEPAVLARLLDVLVSLGLARREASGYAAEPGLAAVARGPGLGLLRADLRSTVLQTGDLFARALGGELTAGWQTSDEVLLQAQGDMSAGAVPFLEQAVFPRLDGVAERLDGAGGAFLDVGLGVASVTIALCRAHPTLRAVGLEPAAAPRALALRNVAAAGLEDRVDVRDQLVQDLEDVAAFDLVWLPGNFLPVAILGDALAAVHRAMRPGGWLINATLGGGEDDLPSAAARLRATLWGGGALEPERFAQLLTDVGFADVVLLDRLPSGLVPMYARRP